MNLLLYESEVVKKKNTNAKFTPESILLGFPKNRRNKGEKWTGGFAYF
jgi:hypothetical protein